MRAVSRYTNPLQQPFTATLYSNPLQQPFTPTLSQCPDLNLNLNLNLDPTPFARVPCVLLGPAPPAVDISVSEQRHICVLTETYLAPSLTFFLSLSRARALSLSRTHQYLKPDVTTI